MEFWKKYGFQIGKKLDFKYLYFSLKKSIILQSCFIKSSIDTIKYHKKIQNFFTSMDRWNRKKYVNKIKKRIVNDGVFEKYLILNIFIS